MKILSFGSLNIDKVYKVTDFVQAGETISSLEFNLFPGGKGLNQSIAAARAGASVYHAGAIGSDGELLKTTLEGAGVHTNYIKKADAPSGHAIIQVNSRGQNCIIIFGGANQSISTADIDTVIQGFEKGDILLLQNEINNLPYIMKKGHEAGLQIVLNPSPITPELMKCPFEFVDIFILNEIEGALLSGEKENKKILNKLAERYPAAKILLTLGSDGCMYKDSEHEASHGIFKIKVVDTTAAGDTFCGYFLASLCGGKTAVEAIRYATGASTLAVSRSGASVSIPVMAEVEEFLATQA